MAITPIGIGTNATAAAGTPSSYTCTTTGAISAGDAVLVLYNVFVASGGSVTAVGDGTNSYNVALASAASSNGFRAGIAYILSAAAVGAGATVTLTLSAPASVSFSAISVFRVAGGLLALDVSATATQGATASYSVGPTGATAQAVELVIAAFGAYGAGGTVAGLTAGGSYSALASVSANRSTTDWTGVYPEYLNTAATGTQTATGSATTAVPASSASVVAAFTARTDTYPLGYHEGLMQQGSPTTLRL